MMDLLKDSAASEVDKQSARGALQARLLDQDPAVIKAIYAESKLLLQTSGEEWIRAVSPSFSSSDRSAAVSCVHLQFINDHLLEAHPHLGEDVFEQLVFPCILQQQTHKGFTVAEWRVLAGERLATIRPIAAIRKGLSKNGDLDPGSAIKALSSEFDLQQAIRFTSRRRGASSGF